MYLVGWAGWKGNIYASGMVVGVASASGGVTSEHVS